MIKPLTELMTYTIVYQTVVTGPSAVLAEVPNNQVIIFAFNRTEIKYITGTRKRVRNVPKINPKIIVHDSGAQKAALSPPK